MHHTRGADALPARCLADLPRQRQVDLRRMLYNAAAVALNVEQAVGRSRFVDMAKHLAKVALVLFARNAKPRLRNKIAERHRHRQLLFPVLQNLLDFANDEFERGVVVDQVMRKQVQQATAVFAVFGETAMQ